MNKNKTLKNLLAMFVLAGLTVSGFGGISTVKAEGDDVIYNHDTEIQEPNSRPISKPLPKPGVNAPCARIVNPQEREKCLGSKVDSIKDRMNQKIEDRTEKGEDKISKIEDRKDKIENKIEKREDGILRHAENLLKRLNATDERIVKLIARTEAAIAKQKTEKGGDTATAEKYLNQAKASEVAAKAKIVEITAALKDIANQPTFTTAAGDETKRWAKPTTTPSTNDGRFAKIRAMVLAVNKDFKDAREALRNAIKSLKPTTAPTTTLPSTTNTDATVRTDATLDTSN